MQPVDLIVSNGNVMFSRATPRYGTMDGGDIDHFGGDEGHFKSTPVSYNAIRRNVKV